VHVVRCFDDPDVTHVLGAVDPVRDRDIVNLELTLADLQTVERRIDRTEKLARSGDRDARTEVAWLGALADALSAGRTAGSVQTASDEEDRFVTSLNLLTRKRQICVANIHESDLPGGDNPHVAHLRQTIAGGGGLAEVIPLSLGIEAEIVELPPGERAGFLADLGLAESGLERLIHAGYRLLDLISFFTYNEKEARAWTVPRGTLAPRAAGEIHTDFERGFIRAETVGWADFERVGSLKMAREQGLIRSEGKDYVVADSTCKHLYF
jgi:GTP-binding protein YchF